MSLWSSELDFWVFSFLEEHAGVSLYAMTPALPDLGIDPFLVSSRHQTVKDFLHTFEPTFGKQ